MKEKQIQIPQNLFLQLVRFHLIDETEADRTAIRKGLETKIDNMVKHELYTRSKTADTEEEREKARKEYLDKIGMHPDFRW